MIRSPLTDSPASKIGSVPTQQIIASYKDALQIDVEKYLHSLEEVEIYKCPETGYQFFYPFSVAGNGKFYEQLQEFDWYYMPWKWEHDTALASIRQTDKILEVGSGGGGFLEKLHLNGYDITGLELNQKSIEESQKKQLKVYGQTIQEHARQYPESYDVVCTFQVLEHISDVHSFINAMVNCLKPGGILIICVPNNDSFIRFSFDRLNVPPHHMGLWNEKSLKYLTKLFPIKLKQVFYQPLQPYHRYYFFSNIYKGFLKLPHFLFKILYRLSPSFLAKFLPKKLSGAYIEVQYTKVSKQEGNNK